MKTVAGIDLGTQSLKVIFYDFESRQIVASESAALDLYQREDGTAEQQAHWWSRALESALGKIDNVVRASVVGIGVSGQQHGFVPLNNAGEVLAPVKLWCDTSTQAECSEIMDRFGGPEACISEVGNPVPPGFTASKITWLKKNHPALYEQLDCILLPHDYLNFLLTGERCMEAGDASGTGFLDITRREWSKDMLSAIDPDRDLSLCLPDLRVNNEIIGRVSSQAAKWLGIPEHTPVSVGGGDNMMGAIGTGNVSPGKVTLSLGTSGTIYAYSDHPVIDPNGEIAAFCSSTGGWLPLMCTMNCTVTTELMRGLMDTDIATFENLVSQAPRGSEGILTVPFFNGERTPNLPGAKACIVGMDSQNTRRENLLRSGLEGATFALRYGMDQLRDLGVKSSEIVLTGGGVNSDTWRQVVADVFATPVKVLRQDEGASFGAALQALNALEGGSRENIEQLVNDHLSMDPSRCCEPSDSSVRFYEQAYQSYREAVAAITPLYR